MSYFDPVHRLTVDLEDWETDLLNLPLVQRLHGIHHLGLAHTVFPGAHHTRYEHALGTLCLVHEYINKMSTLLEKESFVVLCATSILHEVGQGPFSQVFRDILQFEKAAYGIGPGRVGKKTRSLLEDSAEVKRIVSAPLHINNEEANRLVRRICDIVDPQSGLQTIESTIFYGPLGLDRLDYYVRDSRYVGLPFGQVDLEDLLWRLEIRKVDDRFVPVYRKDALASVERVLLNRLHMYHSVYSNEFLRIAESMLDRAILRHIGTDQTKLRELATLRDGELLAILESSGDAAISRIMGMLRIGRSYDRVKDRQVRFTDIRNEAVSGRLFNLRKPENKKELLRLEDAICSSLHSIGSVILDVNAPTVESDIFDESGRDRIYFQTDRGIEPLSERTRSLVNTLLEYEKRNWLFGIYYDSDQVDEASILKQIEKLLGQEARRLFEE